MKRFLSLLAALIIATAASAQQQFGTLKQVNGATISDPGTGGLQLAAAGTNQNININPSGTGGIFTGTAAFTDTGIAHQFTQSVAGYYQIILNNTSNNVAASADFIVANDQGTATTHYGDFGINSSTFTGTGSLALAGATYLYAQTGDLVLGTNTSNAIHFVVNNGATDALTIGTSGALTNILSAALINGATITDPGTGGIALTASGTNQNVVLTPSGTGVTSFGGSQAKGGVFVSGNNGNGTTGKWVEIIYNGTYGIVRSYDRGGAAGTLLAINDLGGNVAIGTATDNSNGKLQFVASTSASAGIVFGNDSPQASIYRSAASTLTTPAIWNVSNTTASSSTTTGSATFGGGIGVAGAINAGGSSTFGGPLTLTPAARSSGVASYLTVNIPADTSITASTEAIGYQHVTAPRQWATTGTVPLQRENFFAGPTYTSASASQTFTDAFTLYATPPVAGTNAILTRGHTLGIVDATSAASSITGGVVVSTTLGTTATSVGIGGGNVNAGGLITGGTITSTGLFTASSTSTFTGATTHNNAVTINGAAATTALTLTQTARTSGVLPYIKYTIPTDTTLTVATEIPGIVGVTGTRQWATGGGTLALQREIFFPGPTYAAAAAMTVTDAFSLYLTPPVQGTNLTITRNHTFGVVDSTSSTTAITGAVVVSTTLGTAATSVGIGGGNITAGGAILASTSTGRIGYLAGSGVGTAVTQLTSRTTGVTSNTATGQITMFTASGSTTAATFTVSCTAIAAGDTVVYSVTSGATNLYEFFTTAITAGTSFNVTFLTTGGTASDTPVVNYTIIKGSSN